MARILCLACDAPQDEAFEFVPADGDDDSDVYEIDCEECGHNKGYEG